METSELVQDVDLHGSDLTELICSENELLYDAIKKRGHETTRAGLGLDRSLHTVRSNVKLRGSPSQVSPKVSNSICKHCHLFVSVLLGMLHAK